ncbi:MAG TPA: TetR/AcrR family transcriptional regulator [Desulfomonilaceae bacterium]|nr:TetR/AcrR family transcriptional regulator [Desulfomonilaceae bacterium]
MKRKNSRHANTPSRRQEIIQAALACFTEQGFAQTSMADIRRRSKASTGSIYHHFKSKEQLAAEVYLEGIKDYQEGFLAVLENEQSARNGILAVIRYHLQWVSEHPDWTRYLFQKAHAEFMASAADVFAGLNAEFMKRCSLWLAVHVKAGTVRRLPPDMYVAILVGPVMEYTRLYLAGQTCTPLEHAMQELATAAWNGLETERSVK